MKGRLARYGRTPDQLLILPAATFTLADTDAEAAELARVVRCQQVSGPTAIAFLEQVWNRDLSGYDRTARCPASTRPPARTRWPAAGPSVRMYRDPRAVAAQWRARAEAGNLSIRELVIEVTGRQTFTGSTAARALRNSIDLAQAAERCGYTRYWFAEHHLNPGVVGTSPAVLLALTAGATSTIRIGSGAVQMGHRTAWAVQAEAVGPADHRGPAGRGDCRTAC